MNQNSEDLRPHQDEIMPQHETHVLETSPHDEEAEHLELYKHFSKQQLVEEYELLADSENILTVRERINAVEEAFRQIKQNEKAQIGEEESTGEEEEPSEKKTDVLTDRFYAAQKIIKKKKHELTVAQEKQKEANLAVKRELIEKLKHIIQNEENLQRAFHAFHEIQEKWRNTGTVPFNEAKDLQLNYRHFTDKFYEYIKINRELQDLDWKKNLELKIRLCEEAEALLFEASVKTALDKLAMLQSKWHETGPVHRNHRTEIIERFKKAADAVIARRKEQIKKLREQQEQNAKLKAELCEEAEKINIPDNATFNDWKKISETVDSLWERWKKTGRAEKNANEALWQRFRKANDVIFKQRKAFFDQRKKEFQTNLQKKNDICNRAEALVQSLDWKAAAAEMRKLNEEWKKVGFVPGKLADKVWDRFRKANQAVFEMRQNHFAEADKEQEANLEKKLDLISRMEHFQLSGDRKSDFEALKNFQHEWSDTGMVPFAKKNEIYNRYKNAIDVLFDKMRLSEMERSELRFKDRLDHLKTSPDGKQKMREEERVLSNKITHLNNELNTLENNLGFFAKSKNADQIKKEFEEKINKAKSELARLRQQLNLIREAK
jgi:hypothetical protein